LKLLVAAALLATSLSVIAASAALGPAAEPAPAGVRSGPANLPARIALTADEAHQAAETGRMAMPVSTLLNIRAPLRYGEFRWDDSGVPPGPVWISIDLHNQLVSVFRGPNEIGTAVILYGAGSNETPIGTFRILAKFRKHRSETYDGAAMPYTLRLTDDGVSIHGSNVREGYATHGCIGIPLDFAAKLFDSASRGDEVVIRAS